MTMDGSSEPGWQRSGSSRGFNASAVSDRNPGLFRAGRIRSSGDASHDSGFVPGRKERDRVVLAHRDLHKIPTGLSGVCEDELTVDPTIRTLEWSDISLRQWLDNPERSVDAVECLLIFTQIVDIVNLAHSQGIVVHNVRPSRFFMSSFNHVSFIESVSCSDSGSDSLEDGSNSQSGGVQRIIFTFSRDLHRQRSQFGTENSELEINLSYASRMVSETSCLQSSSVYPTHNSSEVGSNVEQAEEKKHPFPMKQMLIMETDWYSSPEEVSGAPSSCASDIYRLGVFLFELFCTFSSAEEKSSTMSSLRHRVLPPQLLLKCPREASFCLWLLHPDPSSRPKMSLESMEEQELLLEFLLQIQQRKQESKNNFQDTISFLSSDIEEVTKQQSILWRKGGSCPEIGKDSVSDLPSVEVVEIEESGCSGSRKRNRPGLRNHNSEESSEHLLEDQNSEMPAENQGSIILKSSRLMKNFKKLESAYFFTRHRAIKSSGKSLTRHFPISSDDRGSIVATEKSSVTNLPLKDQYSEARESGWINSFLEGLCKYLSFSKLKVKADLKQGDLLNSSNLVCSLSFDRDGEFFATAGVNKKIKIFEYDTIINEDQDIRYPVVELTSRSKLSNICWNSYIKSQIASSNFEGVVQVWDVTRSQVFMEMREHESRVWSVDFSLADPTMLASGSDDGSVKLWSINQIYYYDLRNSKVPLCTLIGHNKTVSYVKFIDSTNLVSSSTDNTMKLWDLSLCTARVLDCPLQSFTGHTNVKNFVGLSVSEGYIATGSETNEVFIYHKAFPMPALSFKFGSTDPHSGDDVDDTAQFISSVCWRGQSSTLVAANSMGNIKLLEMV
ncbi:Protein SPA1-RELATED 3 [Camellia lanceoleosa]|uniref:Protein SPA1-RELATED 3 n=1 Tax=Camellia lanceoleosa TaxID=1840588 RepID=A0ACC0HCC4_9ERIC|nr:Protein SPA1-RELATED 3 [Camellia lanceoleosa]